MSSITKYTLVSKGTLLCNETLQLVNFSEQYKRNVIQFISAFSSVLPPANTVRGFNFVGDDIKLETNYREEIDTIKLNRLEIKFVDYTTFELNFVDVRTKKRHNLILYVDSLNFNYSTNTLMFLGHALYDGMPIVSRTATIPFATDKYHTKKGYIQKQYGKKHNHLTLNYGLTARQYRLRYRGRILEGRAYMFFLGMYVVLLRDDLTIDAVFTLSSFKDDIVSVRTFIYTSNPLLAKMVVLLSKKGDVD